MPSSLSDYTVACICPMGVELAPVQAMLDEIHPSLPTQRDQNNYTLGKIEGHNMVIAVLPEIGTNAAAMVAIQLLNDFPSIRFGLLVGIGGGMPNEADVCDDIRLGDVVVSESTDTFGGVVQYDMGKQTADGFKRTGTLNKPPAILQSAIQTLLARHERENSRIPRYLGEMVDRFPKMKEKYIYPRHAQDQLFKSTYNHVGGHTCSGCNVAKIIQRPYRAFLGPSIHYGTIGSANRVLKDGTDRDRLKSDMKILCVEMEAAGLMDAFPCLVIRGICDYADSHKNKKWQPYSAATAAAYMKELLSVIPPKDVAKVLPAADVVKMPNYSRGVNLFDAPDMADHLFIGRGTEIRQMENILLPGSDSSNRNLLVLGGMGGIGKTQLAISYSKRHGSFYSSVFWLNATSAVTLKSSLRSVANRIIPLDAVGQLDDDRLWIVVSNWLSESDNSRWLLIYDNYDDPDQYDITQYYPSVAHGSIIVTTRIPSRLNGKRVQIQSITKEEDSLRILATRSEREHVESDLEARQLARRLDGHPLALATAGAYLKESSVSFSKYLQQYEVKWDAIGSIEELADYPTRTLHTTWDLSFTQIKQQNAQAAQLLKFLAYLDHRDIWYELFGGYQGPNAPVWFTQLTQDEYSFEKAIRTLVRYSLAETHYQAGSYSLHVCVHDWTLDGLNRDIDAVQYWLAFNCVSGHFGAEDWDHLSESRYQRITPHASRLVHDRFRQVAKHQESTWTKLGPILFLARLLHQQVQYNAAEKMYLWALAGNEKTLGPDHTSTLNTVGNLGILYSDQGKLAEAEKMYLRALAGYEKALGPDHTSTLRTVNNLGLLYRDQGKLAEAEKMYLRALAGYEKASLSHTILALTTVRNLGLLYHDQGKIEQAKKMFQRAVLGKEIVLGQHHPRTLEVANFLRQIDIEVTEMRVKTPTSATIHQGKGIAGKIHCD